MKYTTLGRTGLTVSVAGLGCGGNSRLGLGGGKSEADAVSLLRAAFDEGVNFFDTAAAYGTEGVVGQAARDFGRDKVVIATKSAVRTGNEPSAPETVLQSLERSLVALGGDYIDVFNMHGVTPDYYDHALGHIYPVLKRAAEAGKIRHIGITESAPRDPEQQMLNRAVDENAPFEVMMLAYSMMNQKAANSLLPRMREQGIGSLIMFAVRNIFSQPQALRQTMSELSDRGLVPRDLTEKDNPLEFLVHSAGATSITDAAYRFARHQSGGDVVLFGTGNIDHLKQNIRSILRPPLPKSDCDRLETMFGGLTGVGLELPNRRRAR